MGVQNKVFRRVTRRLISGYVKLHTSGDLAGRPQSSEIELAKIGPNSSLKKEFIWKPEIDSISDHKIYGIIPFGKHETLTYNDIFRIGIFPHKIK